MSPTTTATSTMINFTEVRESIAKAASSIEDVTGIYAELMLSQAGLPEYPNAQPLVVFDNLCREGILTLKLHQVLKDRPQDKFQVTYGDPTETMLNLAKHRIEKEGWSNNTTARYLSKTNLPSDHFTHTFTNFGIMVSPDPSKGLSELHRILRPGVICAFTTWGSIPWYPNMRVAMASVSELPGLPEDAEKVELPNIFSSEKIWHDPEAVRKYLECHDFVDVEARLIPAVSVSRTSEELRALLKPTWTLVTRFYRTQEQRDVLDNENMFEKMFAWWEEKLRREERIEWNWSAVVTTSRKPA